MSHLPLCCALVVAVIFWGMTSSLPAAEPDTDQLKAFIPSIEIFPASIKVRKQFPGQVDEQVKISLPGVTTDHASIEIIGGHLYDELPKSIEAMMIAYFEEKGDDPPVMGIIGWQLETPGAANEMHKQSGLGDLPSFPKEPDRYQTFVKGRYVFQVWRNLGVSDEAYQALLDHTQEKLKTLE